MTRWSSIRFPGFATRKRRRRTNRSSSIFQPARLTRRIRCQRNGATNTKGKFDQGWDKLREETFARQKQLGVIPANAKLTPRDPAFPAWDSVPPDMKKLYAHQMEVYAGYQENTDNAVGRVVKAIDDMGLTDNTLIIYIFGDNGASMEGTETGTFNEMTTLNGVPLTADQQLKAIKAYGGLEKWGGPDMAPHYAAAWAWAGNAPFQWGKQVASHLGGIRNAMVDLVAKTHQRQGRCAQSVHSLHGCCTDHPRSGRLARAKDKSMVCRRCRCTA